MLRWSDTHVNWHLISVMLELSFIKRHKLDVWCIFSQNLSMIFNYFGSDSRDKMDGHHFRVFAAQYHPNFPHIFISGGWDNTVHVSRGMSLLDLKCPIIDQLNSYPIKYHICVVRNILIHLNTTSVHYLSKKCTHVKYWKKLPRSWTG